MLKIYRRTVIAWRALSAYANSAAPKMAGGNWQEEKKRYLQMSLHEKRKEYVCGEGFISIDALLPYDEAPLRINATRKLPLPDDYSIQTAKNAKLAKKVTLYRGDITTLEVDAIVNAANKSLLGGGGVDGAIHRGAGPMLLLENRSHGGCGVGEVRISGGYQLPAKYVISTVGPQGEKPDLLRKCYKNAMEAAMRLNARTVAFPAISTGIYGYPVKPATHVSCQEVRKALESAEDRFERIIFCVFSEVDEDIYAQVMPTYFPLI